MMLGVNDVGGEMRNGTGSRGRGETGVVLFRENWKTGAGYKLRMNDAS